MAVIKRIKTYCMYLLVHIYYVLILLTERAIASIVFDKLFGYKQKVHIYDINFLCVRYEEISVV